MILSDESPYQLFRKYGKTVIRRRKGERFDEVCVVSTENHPENIHLLFCCPSKFTDLGKKNYCINPKISKYPRKTSHRHCVTLLKLFKMYVGNKGIETMASRSGYFPDLNSIKNLCSFLKIRVDSERSKDIGQFKTFVQ